MFDEKILKMNLLGGMNDYVMHCIQDENLQDEWLTNGVPDELTEEDLEFIANDEHEFAEVVHLFGKLVWSDNK